MTLSQEILYFIMHGLLCGSLPPHPPLFFSLFFYAHKDTVTRQLYTSEKRKANFYIFYPGITPPMCAFTHLHVMYFICDNRKNLFSISHASRCTLYINLTWEGYRSFESFIYLEDDRWRSLNSLPIAIISARLCCVRVNLTSRIMLGYRTYNVLYKSDMYKK